MWTSGAAAARIPTARDLLEIPWAPLTFGVLGQHEPYGSRTDLLLPLLPFGLLAALFRKERPQRRSAILLLAAGVIYYLLISQIAVKTRFHGFVYFALIPIVTLAPAYFQTLGKPARWALKILFYLCILGGMIDIAHVLLKTA